MFKKKKLKARKKSNFSFIKIIGFISIFGIFTLALIVMNKLNNTDFNVYKTFLGPTNNIRDFITLTPKERKQLALETIIKEKIEAKKLDNNQKTNILIIGRGGYGNDAPELTDSIILASVHKGKNHISMLSIPRDLYVNYGDNTKSGKAIKGKINGLYVHFLAKYQDEQKAVKKLEEKITQITNEKIDYYVNIDFNGFIKLVDAIGGVQIDVPKTLIDHRYPNKIHGYQSFILRKGNWLLDGKVALKYVRSRKNTGGDFGRSERQQQVISALKDNILSGETLSSPRKIKKFYNIYNKYLHTDIGLTQAITLFTQIKLQTDTKVYSSGLNTSCSYEDICQKGGYLYYPQRSYFGGTSVLLGESATHNNLDIFTEITQYADIVFNSPKLFDEKYKISIFSKGENKKEAQSLRSNLKKVGLEINISERIGAIPNLGVKINSKHKPKKILNLEEYNKQLNLSNNSTISQDNGIQLEANNMGSKIILNGVDKKSETIKYLQNLLQISDENIIIHPDGPKYAKDLNTQIEIIYTQ